jgi:hypothetical protein
MAIKRILFLVLVLTSLICSQDYDSYNDSVRHADSLSLATSNVPAKIDTSDCILSHTDSLAINILTDSLEHSIDSLDSEWNTCKSLRVYYNQILKPDSLSWDNGHRLNALVQLAGHIRVEPYAVMLLARIGLETVGTQFIISKECGQEQAKAHAHLKKLQQEASQATEFLASLYKQAETKANAISCRGKIKLGR